MLKDNSFFLEAVKEIRRSENLLVGQLPREPLAETILGVFSSNFRL